MSELVSICIPTYNGEKFIEEALLSAVNQTYKNTEIIISDDNSKDDTLLIAYRLLEKYDIPYFIHKHCPNGIGANWNNCVKNANGAYIKFLFQDDILKPTCIEKMVEYINTSPELGLVYCKRDFLFENLNDNNQNWLDKYQNLHLYWNSFVIEDNKPIVGKELIGDLNFLSFPTNKIGEPIAVLFKREVYEKIGCFSEDLKQALDAEYWCRVMKYYSLNFIDETLVSFRLHQNQTSAINTKNKHDEAYVFFKSICKHLFWQLHKKNKIRCIKDMTYIGKIYKKIRGYVHGV